MNEAWGPKFSKAHCFLRRVLHFWPSHSLLNHPSNALGRFWSSGTTVRFHASTACWGWLQVCPWFLHSLAGASGRLWPLSPYLHHGKLPGLNDEGVFMRDQAHGMYSVKVSGSGPLLSERLTSFLDCIAWNCHRWYQWEQFAPWRQEFYQCYVLEPTGCGCVQSVYPPD